MVVRLLFRSFSTGPVPKKPPGFWESVEKQKEFLDELGKKLNIKQLDDWYTIPYEEIKARNAQSFFHRFGGSLPRALTTVYSEYPWEVWRFETVPDGYWSDLRNQRSFFDWLGRKLGYKEWVDWYKIKGSDIKNNGGGSIASEYDHSYQKAITSVYSEYNWDPKKFIHLKSKWKEGNIHLHRELFDSLFKKLGLKKWEDWYHIQLSDLDKMGANHLIREYYGSSLKNALVTVYPEYVWRMWRFGQVPEGYWTNSQHQRAFLDDFANDKNIDSNEGWYRITKQDVYAAGGRMLLELYGDSLSAALEAVYPERNFVPWRFKEGVTPGYWNEDINIKRAYEWIKNQFNIKQMEDWYMVSELRLSNLGLLGLLKKFGGIFGLLNLFHPEYKWDTSVKIRWKSQFHLFLVTQELFPDVDIMTEHVMKEIVYSDSKRNMTVDIFIPALNLALEYQGEQHFRPSELTEQPERIKYKDQEKRKALREFGITLVEVPYWWDQSRESLVTMIQEVRPELLRKKK